MLSQTFNVLLDRDAALAYDYSMDWWPGSQKLFCDDQNCDACHPNDAGYEYLASRIYGKLFGHPLPSNDDPPIMNPKLMAWETKQVDTAFVM